MHRFFALFVETMRSSFRRIARATGHEVTEADLHSDAWILAHDIGKRRGHDPSDQSLIIRAVNVKNVRRGDWKMRRSVRIGQEREGEDGITKWIDRLPAAEISDPLIFLLRHEATLEDEAKLIASYSQATAYIRMFVRFKFNRKAVCNYLLISDSILTRRLNMAALCTQVQPSLFDGIQRIEKRFMPPPGRLFIHSVQLHRAAIQQTWAF